MKVARVVTDLSLDREFDYLIPARLLNHVRVGSRVRVPFGRGGQMRNGYVVGVSDESEYPQLKEISAIEDGREPICESLVRLARWISDYYCCAREQAVRALLPGAVRSGRVREKTVNVAALAPDLDLAAVLPQLERRAPKQAAVLQALVLSGPTPVPVLERETGASSEVIRALRQKNLVTVEASAVARDPFADDIVIATAPHELTGEQTVAVRAVCGAIDARAARVFLLHGVTGSGKTEVYLQSIDHCLAAGREAIVLVPEIALTPQTTERFRSRFGDRVCVLHSGLSDGERFDEWNRASAGRASIVVGARSALFAPFRNLGLIVVDEEHENSYKQDEAPRYHARDVAVVRGQFEKAVVLLGSATPSLESVYNCRRGKYELLQLRSRVDDQKMPVMELIDMRAEAALRGGAQIFSRRLEDLIRSRLDCGDQTILFLNRRGYATQMMCTACGYVATCPDCSLTYTYHRQAEQLICHMCGRVLKAPQACPTCNDSGIRYSGLGTEKVEKVARGLFPKALIARMDSDTMTRKDSHRKTLMEFRAGRIQILIGTQMIAKGLHFPNVTLVGVIMADRGLFLPDFRSGERTFQLLTQVAGRAGRGDKPGHVVVQTYTPFHPALQCALEHNSEAFCDEELETRQALAFPPSTHMAVVHFRGEDEQRTAAYAESFAARLRPHLEAATQVIGPMPAPIAKAKGLFRYQFSLRGGRIMRLTNLLRQAVIDLSGKPKDIDVYVDVDPQSML